MGENLWQNVIFNILVVMQTLYISNSKYFLQYYLKCIRIFPVLICNTCYIPKHWTIKIFFNSFCSSRVVFPKFKQIVMTVSTKRNTSDWRRNRRCLDRLSRQQTHPHFGNWNKITCFLYLCFLFDWKQIVLYFNFKLHLSVIT